MLSKMPECALGEKIGGKRTVVVGKIRYVNKGSAVILLSSFSLLTHLSPCSPTPCCPLPSHATLYKPNHAGAEQTVC